ncbi:hypothetical protein AVEN_106814-1 [Araneus ventricosus]|uniref:Uncharacterized protein n=1 Tax=Araneus ventricosus TaxID=182803 RepID=A0A4Y2X0T1_ARAVE|nr:hypothetical protein AVEN_106814-1 [Araneus ventricosus]
MTKTTPELEPLSPNFHITPVGDCWTHDVRFNVRQVHIQVGSSVETSFEPGAHRHRSRDLNTTALNADLSASSIGVCSPLVNPRVPTLIIYLGKAFITSERKVSSPMTQ